MRKIICFLVLLIPTFFLAQVVQIPERPSPERLVNIFSSSNFISSDEALLLEKKLQSFANKTSNQIVIVIIDDIGDMEPWEFATKLGHQWGVGQQKQDNGIVILVKPIGKEGKRYLEIAIGKGLEGAIPDITAKRIRENEIFPFFKKGQGYLGLDKGTDVLMALATGEYNSDAYGAKSKGNKSSNAKSLIFLGILILFLLIRIMKGGRGSSPISMGTGFLLGSLFSGGRGFGGGDSNGGGFGGFGGGDFGGGGSGGSW